jgi:hypothetical protein
MKNDTTYTVSWAAFLVALLAAFLYCMGLPAQAQTQGPINTPQVNTIYFVKQVPGFYQTIQASVTTACATAGAEIDILPGATPSDTPTAVTGGCTAVGIVDRRTFPSSVYKWVTSAYVLQTTTASGTAGGDLSGTYPNPTVAKINGGAMPVSAGVIGTNALGQPVVNSLTSGNLAQVGTGGTLVNGPAVSNVPLLNNATNFFTGNLYANSLNTTNPTTGLVVAGIGNFNTSLTAPAVNALSAGTATSGANVNSGTFQTQGSIWNGTTSVNEIWSWMDVVGAGANPVSTYTLNHSGTTGYTVVSIPYQTNIGLSGNNVIFLPGVAVQGWNGFLNTWAITQPGIGTFSALNASNPNLAIAGTNRQPPSITQNGWYWNGSTSLSDSWNMGVTLGAGTSPTSTYSFSHSGSPGLATYQIFPFTAFQTGMSVQGGTTAVGVLTATNTTVTTLGVSNTITNAPGIQVATGPGLSVAGGSFANPTITLSPAEPDNAYTVNGCSITGITGTGTPLFSNVNAKTTTTFSIAEFNLSTTNAYSGGTITCLVVHN